MDDLRDAPRVLAIDPTTNGFGFAVMEGQESLVDWGVRIAGREDRDRRCLKLVLAFIEMYHPKVFLVEELRKGRPRRSQRVQNLIESVAGAVEAKNIKVRRFSTHQVRHAFIECGARNKEQIAAETANRLPELIPRLPRHRSPWMSEDYRMAVFDAVALALTYYQFRSTRRKESLSALKTELSNHVEV
jgi:Holliday junction resolvasome RuvABC endonuclease subunit